LPRPWGRRGREGEGACRAEPGAGQEVRAPPSCQGEEEGEGRILETVGPRWRDPRRQQAWDLLVEQLGLRGWQAPLGLPQAGQQRQAELLEPAGWCLWVL